MSERLLDLSESLPDPLPEGPMGVFSRWWAEHLAARTQANPDAMALATCGRDGRASVRIVLCKEVDAAGGSLVFYTNHDGRKGRELAENPWASCVFHFDHAGRQARFEGLVVRCTSAESDAYFARRAVISRVGAWASDQSRPLASRDELLRRVEEVMARFGVKDPNDPGAKVPRPPNWGGFRLHAQRVELWLGGSGRLHDRAEWVREVALNGAAARCGPWRGTRLYP